MNLKLENLSKSFGDRRILDSFSLEFTRGSITCLFGPSGCGKTTLLHIMGGISAPDSGERRGFDEEKVSFIFQETRILPWKTVLGNVMFPLAGLPEVTDPEGTAMRFIQMVGLEKEAGFYPSQLSGGMRQRVSIARAFAYPGSLILMDEAFQSLDNLLKFNILDSFLKIWETDRRTVIFVTHDPMEAVRLGQSIVLLEPDPLKVLEVVSCKKGDEETALGKIRQRISQ